MRDMLTRDRIQIEGGRAHAPFILVGAPQATNIRALLQQAQVRFNLRTHAYTDDVMIELDPNADLKAVQRLLDQVD
ncbi:MAG: hypothetical protein ACAI44_16300 [Candidatus Sericytochromatia bacterium]